MINRLEHNLKYWLQWGFLNIGAWTDISFGQQTLGGEDVSALRSLDCVSCPNNSGRFWQSFHKHWVWDSGIIYEDTDGGTHSPLVPSVKVDNVVVDPTGYYVDYENGYIVFHQAISLNSTVQAQYSVEQVQIYIGDEEPWWQELQFLSWNVDQNLFQAAGAGEWVVNGKHRIQLPCIILNSYAGELKPCGLGDSPWKRVQPVKFHVITEDKWLRDNIVDTIILQANKCIPLFNIDLADASGHLPLSCSGTFDGYTYPQLIENHSWAYARGETPFIEMLAASHPSFHEGLVSITYSVIFNGV